MARKEYTNARLWKEVHKKIMKVAKTNGRSLNSELAITYGVKIK